MGLKRLTAPAVQPVTVDAFKVHGRVDSPEDIEQDLMSAYLEAATEYLDGYAGILGRCLIAQQWLLTLDAFPCGDLKLPLTPLISVDEVAYVDAAGTPQVMPSTDYFVDDTSLHPWIIPNAGWPVAMATANAVQVKFTAGYGPTAADVPKPIVQAIKLIAAHWYQNRESATADVQSEISFGALAMLAPFRTNFIQ